MLILVAIGCVYVYCLLMVNLAEHDDTRIRRILPKGAGDVMPILPM
jgi:hypothetical protein